MLSPDIEKYVNNSRINGKLCGWNKPVVNVFVTPMVSGANKEFWYSKVGEALAFWNNVLAANNIDKSFRIVDTPRESDIAVHWVKVGRVYEGMCKYLSVVDGVLRKISIDIGMPNEYSGKDTTDLSIYCSIMHEFGHALGLGHGVDVNDIMFVPHQKNISIPSENDIYVLKQIYL